MYSQRDEEKHILEAVKDSTNKRLLDIGAWDPITFSNSRALIEQGWGGVLIEFSPKPLRALIEAYKTRADIDVVAAAVGVQSSLQQFTFTDDAVSALIDSAQAQTWKAAGNYYGRGFVPVLSLVEILAQFGAFDFVSIDTEGTSVDLLKALLATEMFPKCICVEHDGRVIELLQMARARQYHSVYESDENIVLSL